MASTRKPDKLKLLQGTFRKDRSEAVNPAPWTPDDTADREALLTFYKNPPVFLNFHAAKVWGWIVPKLIEAGRIREVDYYQIANYCKLAGLVEEGLLLAATQMAQMRLIANDYGMSVVGRLKLPGDRKPKKNKFEDL